MYIYLSKILPLVVLPIGIVIELSIIALVFLWKGKRVLATIFLVASMLVLWVSSMPIVANNLLGRLEQQNPAVTLSDIPDSDCIVLLGGAVGPVLPPRVDVDLLAAADRVFKAASLYHAGKGSLIIVAGGNQPWSPFKETEAEAISSVLVDWGVPVSAILLDKKSRNTRENIINVRVLLGDSGCGTPLLITSAAHMKRSIASFAKVGIRVFPVSVDVRVVRTSKLTVFDFFPDVKALDKTTTAMREWIGQKYYRLRGWN